MRSLRVASLTAVVCVAGLLTAAPGAAAGGYLGSWVATDTLDGSNLSLSIHSGGGGHYAVREVDDAATVCNGAAASLNGSGAVDGDTLVVPVTLACMPGGNIIRQRIV